MCSLILSYFDRFFQLNNPLAHELTTGPEIIEAVVSTPSTPEKPSSGKVDVLVAGAGTGGTVTGTSRAMRKHNPDCIIVGLDPVCTPLHTGQALALILFTQQKGSILAVPESLNEADAGKPYVVEGIGYDFIPDVLDRKDVDVWMKTSDEESFAAVRMLMRSEGLLVGGSSGTALAGALKWLGTEEGQVIANELGKNVVVLLPDGYGLLFS